MPPATKETQPAGVRPFLFHGLDLSPAGSEYLGECFACGKSKLYVKPETGQYDCKTCGTRGNPVTFLRWLHAESDRATKDTADIAADRGLVYPETPMRWGVVRSVLSGDILVPGFNGDGKLTTLYKYAGPPGKRVLYNTPTMNQALFRPDDYDPGVPGRVVCEGPWDGMALWEALGGAKKAGDNGDGHLVPTGNVGASLRAAVGVVAVPGCTSWRDDWNGPVFGGKAVRLAFDNDHPRVHPVTKAEVGLQGFNGMRRAAASLSRAETLPASVEYLDWGGNGSGFDKELKSGYDVRDFLASGAGTSRVKRLESLLKKFAPVPADWVPGRSRSAVAAGRVDTSPLECTTWRELTNVWRKALKWTDGLDGALAVMLSSCASVDLPGDQLWIKVIGPPSCLDGDTPIHDPVCGTTVTVRERCRRGEAFHVYTMLEDGNPGVTIALPPQELPETSMYRVTTAGGKTFRVTGGHQFLTASGYVRLDELSQHGLGDDAYRLPTISGIDLSTRTRGVRRCSETTGGSARVCSVKSKGDRLTLEDSDEIVKVEYDGEDVYYDFHVPVTNNYWAGGLFHHNCGKSTLAEALSANKKYVEANSTMRGFHSGYKESDDKAEDHSFVKRLNGKTLVTKDGDTLVKSPNKDVILSEARDIYDRVFRVDYRNGVRRAGEGVNLTWILCGTSSLRDLDGSELGERFVDYVIMEEIDEGLEAEIGRRSAYRTRAMLTGGGGNSAGDDAAGLEARRKTAGYLTYLRENVVGLMHGLDMSDESLELIQALASFVSFTRARPSKTQDEEVTRELSTRLTGQLTRLAACLAVVTGKTSVDDDVIRRTAKVALDSCRGRTLNLFRVLRKYPDGRTSGQIEVECHEDEKKLTPLLRFLRRIKAVEAFVPPPPPGKTRSPGTHYRLSTRLEKLYDVAHPAIPH